MRPSPPLAVDSALAGPWRAATVLVVAAVPGVLVSWALALLESGPQAALAAACAVALVMAGGAAIALPRHPRRLAYTDGDWTVSSHGAAALAGHPVIALDLGDCMLVRFDLVPVAAGHVGCTGRAAGPGRRAPRRLWLPLAAASAPLDWASLRAALWTWRPAPTPGSALPR